MFPDAVTGKIDDAQVEFTLATKFPYYRKLNVQQKELFRERLQDLLSIKKFVPRQEMIMTDEVRILIAACASQLTLGLQNIRFSQFEYILVYPQEYQNPITKNYHRGETNLAGFMCLSWKDILLGISNEHDNFNLGLHEFSHALRLNSFKGGSEDPFFDGYFSKVIATGVDEYYRVKNGKPSIFRKYAGSNLHEFFPVIVEHWFENPEQFKEHHPDLYKRLCILLNQEVSENNVKLDLREQLLRENTYNLVAGNTQLVVRPTIKSNLLSMVLIGIVVFLACVALNNAGWVPFGIVLLIIAAFLVLRFLSRYNEVVFYADGFTIRKMYEKSTYSYSYNTMMAATLVEAMDDEEKVTPLGYANELAVEYLNKHKEFVRIDVSCKINLDDVSSLRQLLLRHQVNVLLNGFYTFAEKGTKPSSKN